MLCRRAAAGRKTASDVSDEGGNTVKREWKGKIAAEPMERRFACKPKFPGEFSGREELGPTEPRFVRPYRPSAAPAPLRDAQPRRHRPPRPAFQSAQLARSRRCYRHRASPRRALSRSLAASRDRIRDVPATPPPKVAESFRRRRQSVTQGRQGVQSGWARGFRRRPGSTPCRLPFPSVHSGVSPPFSSPSPAPFPPCWRKPPAR